MAIESTTRKASNLKITFTKHRSIIQSRHTKQGQREKTWVARERESDGETEGERGRERDREIETERGRERDREIEGKLWREREREGEREKGSDREREKGRGS